MRPVQFTEIDGRPARQCIGCGVVKPFDFFVWDSRREKPKSRCFDCVNAARRAKYVPQWRKDWWWSPEEVAALRRARDVIEAAALTGRTVNACRMKALNHGIRIPKMQRRTPSPSKWAGTPDEAAIVEAAQRRISFSAIAKRHGITRDTVAGIVWRYRKRNGR